MTMKNARIASVSAENDKWLRQATSAAVAKVRELIGPKELIASSTPAGRLSDAQLTWAVSAAIWAWIDVRGAQAATEGLDPERAIRVTGLDPDPWDAGAVKAILPELAKSCVGFNWNAPASSWTKDELAQFLLTAFTLTQRAMTARDAVEDQVAGKPINPDIVARQLNRAGGNPAMTVDEFNDGADF
jgi:hypothetical protein